MISTVIGLALIRAYEQEQMRSFYYQEIELISKLIGEYLVPSIAFNDVEGSYNDLSKSSSIHDIIGLKLYDTSGVLITQYFNDSLNQNQFKKVPIFLANDSIYFIDKTLVANHRIIYKDLYYGNLMIFASYDKILSWNNNLGISILLILGLVFVITLLFSYAMQKIISEPIILLTNTVANILQTKNFTFRVKNTNMDETGILSNKFNQMLDTIENHIIDKENDNKIIHESELRYKLLLKIQLFQFFFLKMTNV